MEHNPIGVLNGQGGELLMEMIQGHGGRLAFPKDKNRALLDSLEDLADEGYVEFLQETAGEVTYGLVDDAPKTPPH